MDTNSNLPTDNMLLNDIKAFLSEHYPPARSIQEATLFRSLDDIVEAINSNFPAVMQRNDVYLLMTGMGYLYQPVGHTMKSYFLIYKQ